MIAMCSSRKQRLSSCDEIASAWLPADLRDLEHDAYGRSLLLQ